MVGMRYGERRLIGHQESLSENLEEGRRQWILLDVLGRTKLGGILHRTNIIHFTAYVCEKSVAL